MPTAAGARAPEASAKPRVSVIVLTASGARHLPACLASLAAHDWPADRTELLVVDNGATPGLEEAVAAACPGARVVRTGANLGFAAGNNVGARAASGEWLIFLNDDTRVAPDWIDALVDVARRRDAACVGALVLDWTGARVDFAGGLVNAEGRGFSLDYDLAVADAAMDERPILFGCGAAMMIRREVFEACGGWDEPTFAYYEDVELGWRLWMLGHEVWFAPRAIVYHRHHGTSGSSPARQRAFERNALRLLYALLEERTLQRVLPFALLLAADRALLGTPFSRAEEDAGARAVGRAWTLSRRLHPTVVRIRLLHALSRRGARRRYGTISNLRRVGISGLAGALLDTLRDLRAGWEHAGARVPYLLERTAPGAGVDAVAAVPADTVAALRGIRDFFDALPELATRRAWLQGRRRRSDAEILDRFGGYWRHAVPSAHHDRHVVLRRAIGAALSAVGPPLPHETDLVDPPARAERGGDAARSASQALAEPRQE